MILEKRVNVTMILVFSKILSVTFPQGKKKITKGKSYKIKVNSGKNIHHSLDAVLLNCLISSEPKLKEKIRRIVIHGS